MKKHIQLLLACCLSFFCLQAQAAAYTFFLQGGETKLLTLCEQFNKTAPDPVSFNNDEKQLQVKVKVSEGYYTFASLFERYFKPHQLAYTTTGKQTIIYHIKDAAAIQYRLQQMAADVKQTHTLQGIISDKDGKPVPGSTVNLRGTTMGAISDEKGKYTIFNVPAGKYMLIVTALGYKANGIEIEVNTDLTQNLTLQEDLLALGEVVVTGSTTPKRKIESSVAITSIRSSKIEELAPQSTADLLQAVPGFVVETSGGEVGNNLFARGIPSAGAYEYVQIQEDGLPVFEDGALQFANADNWLRVDETVSRMEAVRGGSGAIFATNAPGGIINFISKTGGNNFAGTAKLTAGTSSLFRTDLNIGGPLVKDKLFFNIGGFYRVDNGIRNPGFTGNRGGQVKMNLKYNLDNGYIKLYYKKLDDRNLFLLPIPLTDKDHPKGIKGFDPNYGTLTSRNFSNLRIPQFGGGYYQRDLENGVHPVVDAIGGEANIDLKNGFSVTNSMRYTKINLNYTAIFPGEEPKTAADFARTYTSNGVAFPVNNPGYYNVNTGQRVNPELVAKVGYWAIDKQMDNFANDLRFKYTNQVVDLSFGYYYSNWKSNQQWNWSNMLIEVSDNPQLLNLVDESLTSSSPNYSRTYNGVSEISWLTRDAQLKGNINAPYLNAEIKANKQLTFDLGVRYDIDRYSGYKGTSTTRNLDNNTSFGYDFKTTTADNAMSSTEGPYYYWKYNIDRFSYSAAANYKFTDNMAAYLRYSNGFRSPIEEAYYDNADKLSTIKETVVNQYELGYKYQGRSIAVFANLFYMNLDNIAFTDILVNGQSENKFAKAHNMGIELETELNLRRFNVSLSATFQDPKFTDFKGTGYDYKDNKVRRIPSVYGTLRPSYKFTDRLMAYVEWQYFGKKYSDNANVFALPAFNTLDAGVAYKVNKVRFAVDVSNITNTIGLTEGNPRITAAPGAIYYARPILGRFGKASVTIDF